VEPYSAKKPRGRPFGYRLSEETKNKISKGRQGSKHSEKTKDKISKSLTAYFKRRDSLADSIANEYSYISEEASEWVVDNKEEIDNEEYSILTEKRLSYLKQIEICIGSDIEHLFGHDTNPEFLMILREELQEKCDPELLKEFYSIV